MFHQTDLSLVLDGLVRRTVLAHTERVVRPDIDYMQVHQGSQTHGGFHIVREDEERTARRNHAPMQRHTVGNAGHRQLRNACLENLPEKSPFEKALVFLR